MATTAFNGRELVISMDSTTLKGIRNRGFTVDNSPIDVTTDDDSGWRTLLPDPGVRSVEYPVAGITSDEVLINEIFTAIGSGTHATIKVNLPSTLLTPGNITGSAMLTNLQINGATDGAVEFTATLQSSGAQTYTASV